MNSRSRKKGLAGAVFLLCLLVLKLTSGSGYLAASPAEAPTLWVALPQAANPPMVRPWQPTRVPAGTQFVGEQACAQCHQERVNIHQESSMRQALTLGPESAILVNNPRLTFKVGSYAYELVRQNGQSYYTVSDGVAKISVPITYAFGQGKAGQTYVLQYQNEYYESRVSYYRDIQGLDFTIGSPTTVPRSLVEAFGRKLSASETMKCFNCHATGAVIGGKLQLETMKPGIRCEACHGPGGEHVAAGKAGQPNANKIFNPARLSSDAITQDFCASCHRPFENVSLLRKMGDINVRFQPYRIFNSKCYTDDKRISCTACHNPHEQLKQEAAHYDARCLACHTTGKKAAKLITAAGADPFAPPCPVETTNCTSCHMPKVEPTGAHFKFTDHFIRVVKPNEAYPN